MLLTQGQKAAEGSRQVKQAKQNERNMGLSVRSYYEDEITGEDRYQHKFSWGVNSRTPRLDPSGSAYKMSPSYSKLLITSGVSMVTAIGGAMVAFDGWRNGNTVKLIGGSVVTAASLAMVAPISIDL
jgi:hypothetical protein